MATPAPEWIVEPPAPAPQRERLCAEAGLHPQVAEILLRRDITEPAAAQAFLQPRLEHLHDPFALLGMDAAVARIVRALRDGERIVVSGDYDVDGITSTALLTHFLRAAGAQDLAYFIPNRFEHGYGLTARTVEALLALRPALVITVDNGITAVDEVARLHAASVDTIVTDHHLPRPEGVPEGIVVNPVQPGCGYPDQRICGCGVAFKLVTALRKALRDAQWWGVQRPEPNLKAYLDLVAVATVADIVPLRGENRVLTHYGLQVLNTPPLRPGLQALLHAGRGGNGGGGNGGERRPVTARTLAFQVGPRLNAAGRMTDGALAVELLLSDDPARTTALAAQLEQENDQRRAKGEEMFREAVQRIESNGSAADDSAADSTTTDNTAAGSRGGLVVASEAFHEGIIGIVASRLVERYHCPVLVLADTGTAYKGSARSIPGVNVTEAIRAGAEYLAEYGGHAGAAGCTLPREHLAAFTAAFEAACARLAVAAGPPVVPLEGRLEPAAIDAALVEQLQRLEPFGHQNEEPLFLLEPEAVAVPPAVLKERHLKWRLPGEVEMVAWNMAGHYAHDARHRYRVRLGFNDFRGRRRIQLTVAEMRAGA